VLAGKLRRWLRGLGSGPCARCGAHTAQGFCVDCRRDFVRVSEPCRRCGLSRGTGDPRHRCPGESCTWGIDEMAVPFEYAPPLTPFLHALKYGRQRSLGLALGELLRDALVGRDLVWDAIVVVPLHPARLRQRAFNQADEIARPIARAFSSPILTRGIHRCIDTPPQTTLGRQARLASPGSAFAVRRELAGLTIAIVDDVVTTGATMSALAGALRDAGAGRIVGLAVARSLGGDDGASRWQTHS
jgi:ComF family protein